MLDSILFETEAQSRAARPQAGPDLLKDLALAPILKRLRERSAWDGAAQIFLTPLDDRALIVYRQQIMQDLGCEALRLKTAAFAGSIRELAKQLQALCKEPDFYTDPMNCSLCLQLADRYCNAVADFAALDRGPVHSRGLGRFLDQLASYAGSAAFRGLQSAASALHRQFEQVHVCMLVKDGQLRLRPYEEQRPVDDEVNALFARFAQKEQQHEAKKPCAMRYSHAVDAAVLDLLTRWYPDALDALHRFAREQHSFVEEGVLRFANEVCFYLSWHQLLAPLKARGLPFCIPALGEEGAALCCREGFDLALALDLCEQSKAVVPNDFELTEPERVLVVSGPNQGGKTTFARAFGQAFYLSALGCCIPGRRAELRCFDRLFTHFNREEDLDSMSGTLLDDRMRLLDILRQATRHSVLIINEIYASTTVQDAVLLGRRMMGALSQLGCTALCVTFLDELASYDEHTVSMMSTVDPDDPTIRCFKIVRKPADGMAYAAHLAQKYNLSYEALNRRLER